MSNTIVEMIIEGETCSKANSRRIVRTKKGGSMVIKSQKALDYVKSFAEQCPTLEPLAEKDVAVDITIYYASRRPDLDESLILDCMQDKIYKNDRAVKEKHIYWGGVDKERPRAEIRVRYL